MMTRRAWLLADDRAGVGTAMITTRRCARATRSSPPHRPARRHLQRLCRPPGAGPAAEAGRAAAEPSLLADRGQGSAADGVRVRVVDPGDGPRGDPPGIQG